jgi:hypothetical protein
MRTILRILAATIPATTAPAGTVTLTCIRDNTLYEDPAGSISNALGQHMFAGRVSSGGLRRALVRFDPASAIPAGSTITSVRLTLSMSRSIDGGSSVGLHRALADWGEGTSQATDQEGGGDLATPGDATWVHTFFNSRTWAAAGGDFSVTASAVRTVGGIGLYTWPSTAALVADVQAWLDDPSTNFGWCIRGEEAFTRTAKRFDTRENADPALRPALVIDFTPPPCPGDEDGDRTVTFADITFVLGLWGNPYGFGDITIVLANWGAAC